MAKSSLRGPSLQFDWSVLPIGECSVDLKNPNLNEAFQFDKFDQKVTDMINDVSGETFKKSRKKI